VKVKTVKIQPIPTQKSAFVLSYSVSEKGIQVMDIVTLYVTTIE